MWLMISKRYLSHFSKVVKGNLCCANDSRLLSLFLSFVSRNPFPPDPNQSLPFHRHTPHTNTQTRNPPAFVSVVRSSTPLKKYPKWMLPQPGGFSNVSGVDHRGGERRPCPSFSCRGRAGKEDRRTKRFFPTCSTACTRLLQATAACSGVPSVKYFFRFLCASQSLRPFLPFGSFFPAKTKKNAFRLQTRVRRRYRCM